MTSKIDAPICAQATMDTLGALTINNVLMHADGAWNVLNPHVLWFPSADRGSNVVISHTRGRRAQPWRYDEGTYSMQIIIDGVLDQDGDPHDNPWMGLQLNSDYLLANVFLPPTAPAATRDASLDMPDGSTRVATVQPRLLVPPRDALCASFVTTFTLKVMEGLFEEETS